MCFNMIKQVFYIKKYWKVIVYYNIDYDLFYIIKKDLVDINLPIRRIANLKHNLQTNSYGVTISNIKEKVSIVCFNYHDNKNEYLSTIVHEAEHVKQHILKHYNIVDEDENAAYTIGYIVKQMYDVLTDIICCD